MWAADIAKEPHASAPAPPATSAMAPAAAPAPVSRELHAKDAAILDALDASPNVRKGYALARRRQLGWVDTDGASAAPAPTTADTRLRGTAGRILVPGERPQPPTRPPPPGTTSAASAAKGGGSMTFASTVEVQVVHFAAADDVDRRGIERNAEGCEEPHSEHPELWNVDGTEVDLSEGHKYDGHAAAARPCRPAMPQLPGAFPLLAAAFHSCLADVCTRRHRSRATPLLCAGTRWASSSGTSRTAPRMRSRRASRLRASRVRSARLVSNQELDWSHHAALPHR